MELSGVLLAAWAVLVLLIGVLLWLLTGDPAAGVPEMPGTTDPAAE
jgi:hypothetical protein